MKKTYQAPKTNVVNIALKHMIAASAPMYGQNATGAGMSREDEDLWDE